MERITLYSILVYVCVLLLFAGFIKLTSDEMTSGYCREREIFYNSVVIGVVVTINKWIDSENHAQPYIRVGNHSDTEVYDFLIWNGNRSYNFAQIGAGDSLLKEEKSNII